MVVTRRVSGGRVCSAVLTAGERRVVFGMYAGGFSGERLSRGEMGVDMWDCGFETCDEIPD